MAGAIPRDQPGGEKAMSGPSEPRCTYCLLLIDPDEDAQRIAARLYAHTRCAWVVEDLRWVGGDLWQNGGQTHGYE